MERQCGGYNDYHFVTSLLDGSDLLCKICRFPSRNPHLSSCCGHTFCKFCIDNLKEATTINYACPVCCDSEFSVVQNKQINRAVRSLHVYCTNEKEGCKWQGEVNDVDTHLKSCQFEGVKCENRRCEKIFQRQFVKSHMNFDCPYRDVSCQHCYSIGTHYYIEGKHKDECSKFPLPCLNGCDVGTVAREDVDKHREVCPLEMIECDYYNMGCEAKIARKDIKAHNRENVDKHLNLVKCDLARTRKGLIQAQADGMATVQKMIDLPKKFQEHINDTETQRRKNINQLEAQLYNSLCQVHKNCNPWTLKLNALAAMSTSGEQVVPVVLKMTNFSRMIKEKECWESDGFYSQDKECKMCLAVYTGDNTDGYLSVQLSLVYDGSEMPLMANINLLNQINDCEHHCVKLDSCNATVAKSEWMIFSEWKNPTFVPLSHLYAVSDTCSFIKNDSVFFEVYVQMRVTEESQSSHPFFPHKESVCATGINDRPLSLSVQVTEDVHQLKNSICLPNDSSDQTANNFKSQSKEQIITCILTKNKKGLGFNIAGGKGTEHIPDDDGIFITKIIPDGAASEEGSLTVGDRIVQVNKYSMLGITHKMAVDVFHSTGHCVEICYVQGGSTQAYTSRTNVYKSNSISQETRRHSSTSTSPYSERFVTFERPEGTGLGFRITGGVDGFGIFIWSVTTGSIADTTKLVKVGDQILKVNKADLSNVTYEEAVWILKGAGTHVELLVKYRPSEFIKLQSINDQQDDSEGGDMQLQRKAHPHKAHVSTVDDTQPSPSAAKVFRILGSIDDSEDFNTGQGTKDLQTQEKQLCDNCKASFARILKKKYICNDCGGNYCKSCTVQVRKSSLGVSSTRAVSELVRVCLACSKQLK